MESVIKCLHVEFPLSFHRARVIHADKYSQAYGGALDFPVFSNLYTDVVFRLNENNQDYKAYIENLDLPIYTDQDVTVICSGRTVLGYIDMQTNYYYYTVTNFSRVLGFGVRSLWVWLITIVVGIVMYFINKEQIFLRVFLLFISLYVIFRVQRWYVNYRIRSAIDAALA